MHRMVVLDGLRGIAAIAVVCLHILHRAFPFVPSPAYLAVDFFFLLSGFVIGRTYEQKLLSGMSVIQYMGIRLRRLYPSIATGVLLGATVAIALNDEGPIIFWAVMQLALLPAPGIIVLFPLNGVQWSLFLEIVANLVHALIVRFLSNVVLTIVVGIALVALIVELQINPSLEGGFHWDNFWTGVVRVSFSFFAGLAVWRIHASGRMKFPSLPGWVPIAGLGVVLLVPTPGFFAIHDLVSVAIAFPIILLSAVNARELGSLSGLASYTGLISYPLYATHIPIVLATKPWLLAAPIPWPLKAAACVALVLFCIIVADLVERFVERPGRRALEFRRSKVG